MSTEPLSKRSAVLHTMLGALALVALYASHLQKLAPYANIITGVCALLGVGSVAAARAYLPPRVLAILESFSPTPPAVTAGTIVAGQASQR